MSFRTFRSLALCCSAVLAACGTGSRIVATAGSGTAATVRFVNATATPLDLATGGSVTTAHANIVSGSSVACFSVAEPTVPGLSVRQAGTTTDLSGFAPVLSSGGHYTLVAYPNSLGGAIQFATIPSAAAPVIGRSTLRVFDGSAGLGQVDVYITAPGATLGTAQMSGLGFGTFTSAFDVAAGATQVRLTTTATTTVVFDAGSQTLEAGKSFTLVISSATAAILVPDC